MRLLLVEDTQSLARLVADSLRAARLVVDHVGSLAEARAALATVTYDVAVLDRRLPDGDGMALLAPIRAAATGTRVIMLTALDAVPDRVEGLDAGADDYLVKPFAMPELLARIRVGLRRPGGVRPAPIRCGRLSLDPSRREVCLGDTPLPLPRRELAILELLMTRAGRVVLRETFMDRVYALDDAVASNALDSQVSRLRRRLAQRDAGVVIHPVRGVGYLLSAA